MILYPNLFFFFQLFLVAKQSKKCQSHRTQESNVAQHQIVTLQKAHGFQNLYTKINFKKISSTWCKLMKPNLNLVAQFEKFKKKKKKSFPH